MSSNYVRCYQGYSVAWIQSTVGSDLKTGAARRVLAQRGGGKSLCFVCIVDPS